MSRGLFRKTSFNKMLGAYRSQWKRFWLRLFTFGAYGSKGIGWLRDPKRAWYNWLYHRTSISIPRLLGYRPSRFSSFCAILIASIIGVISAPVDAYKAGVKANKIRKFKKSQSESKEKNISTFDKTANSNKATTSKLHTASSVAVDSTSSDKTKAVTSKATAGCTPIKQKESEKTNYTVISSLFNYEIPKSVTHTEHEVKEPDDNTPKSTPKHSSDRYIRKRMIIAGSSYCEKDVLQRLKIGTYLEIAPEPSNPYDKDAIMLKYNGEKVGYIPKKDNLPFVTSLSLNRKIYAVITDIIIEETTTKYEFETWFDLDE